MSSGFALHSNRVCVLFFIIMFIDIAKIVVISFHSSMNEISFDFSLLILIDSSSLILVVQVYYAIKGS